MIHHDRSIEVLAQPRADLLLGVRPTVERHEHETTLGWGSTVLLYTDGLIESRTATIDDGLDRLVAAITELGDGTLDELCDGLLERMVDGRPDDDVALVAVRLHPQDRPRPADAGPNVVPTAVPRPAAVAEGR